MPCPLQEQKANRKMKRKKKIAYLRNCFFAAPFGSVLLAALRSFYVFVGLFEFLMSRIPRKVFVRLLLDQLRSSADPINDFGVMNVADPDACLFRRF
ncbi:transmembrane protein, putative [Medicago truncatula]|uniref:Transmembrane protein, putative n=1 Tax=Medicago truncatula TaxID=3880 RepID=G7JZ60_MEDTR|nr:transmembrane protein, putative [Medicago truncatula]